MTDVLTANPSFRFIWVESVYLEQWWTSTTAAYRSKFVQLVRNGQLELVSGGWGASRTTIVVVGATRTSVTDLPHPPTHDQSWKTRRCRTWMRILRRSACHCRWAVSACASHPAAHMSSALQMTQGHEFLQRVFGVRPKYGWQIDPFGASTFTPKFFAKVFLPAGGELIHACSSC